MQLIKNLLFYIGLFIFLFGVGNTLFDFTNGLYELTIIYISYSGIFMMVYGDAYPKNARELGKQKLEELQKEEIKNIEEKEDILIEKEDISIEKEDISIEKENIRIENNKDTSKEITEENIDLDLNKKDKI